MTDQHGENKENSDTNTETKTKTKTETKAGTSADVLTEQTKNEAKALTRKSATSIILPRNKSAKSVQSATGQNATSRIKMRKHSIGMNSIMSVRRNDLASSQALEFKRPFIAFEPTYQLEPITRFDCERVEIIINEVLDNTYEGHKYHEDATPVLAVKLANVIMREVKHLLFNRYRILSVVSIGQKRAQSYNNTISFIWDPLRDAYADVHRENNTTFVQVTVLGIYLD